jgi:hypothetical protein
MVYTPYSAKNKVFFCSNLEVVRQQLAAAAVGHGGGGDARFLLAAAAGAGARFSVCKHIAIASSAATESCPILTTTGSTQSPTLR